MTTTYAVADTVPSTGNVTSLEELRIVEDSDELLHYGICRVAIPIHVIDLPKWAKELSQLTPLNMAGEGDAEYAFYRNILDEEDFPFDSILQSEIGACIQRYFAVTDSTIQQQQQQQQQIALQDVIRLDDAFCVHYNTDQADTSGAKHTDPSDITVNLCLEKSEDAQGSQVLFYGTKPLSGLEGRATSQPTPETSDDTVIKFLVDQKAGYATIHWGNHPHETLALKQGRRTNVVLTYCFRDATRSDVNKRSCYFDS